MNIRLYKDSDLKIIKEWAKAHNEYIPESEYLPKDSTFILEIDNKPLVVMTVYLTNCKEIAYLENLMKDPEFVGSVKDEAVQMIFNHCENFTKEQGFKRLIALTSVEPLKTKYQNLGYNKFLNNLSAFAKEI